MPLKCTNTLRLSSLTQFGPHPCVQVPQVVSARQRHSSVKFVTLKAPISAAPGHLYGVWVVTFCGGFAEADYYAAGIFGDHSLEEFYGCAGWVAVVLAVPEG